MLALGFFACTNPEKNTEGNGSLPNTGTVQNNTPVSKLDSVSEYLKANPNDANAYNQRAMLNLKAGKGPYAELDIQQAIRLDSLNANHHLAKGKIMVGNKKTRLAKESWENCIKLDPKSVECRLRLAELLSSAPKAGPNSADYTKSMQLLNKVLELEPQNAVAFYFKGINYVQNADTAKAINNLQLAVQYDQKFLLAFELLGALYAGKGDPLAENYYNIAIDINPNIARTHHNLGVYYKDVGEYNKAIDAYSKAVQLDPSFTDAHYALGYLHYDLNVLDVAVMHFTNGIESRERDYRCYFGRGLSYERMGDVANAEADYRKCLSIWKYDPAIEALTRITGKAPQLD